MGLLAIGYYHCVLYAGQSCFGIPGEGNYSWLPAAGYAGPAGLSGDELEKDTGGAEMGYHF